MEVEYGGFAPSSNETFASLFTYNLLKGNSEQFWLMSNLSDNTFYKQFENLVKHNQLLKEGSFY